MSDEKRVQTFEVIGDEPVMGHVHGEQFTVIDLDAEREAEYLGDRSLKFVSGDEPRTKKSSTPTSPKGR